MSQAPAKSESQWVARSGWRIVALALLCTGAAQNSVDARETDPVGARTVTKLAEVHVNASRLDLTPFNVPAALGEVHLRLADAGLPGVNLSEALVGVPGILARNRQNYAQDEQISIRGFGSRSTFGVRSIRIFMDGIPSSLPDGQGQVSQFNLDSADRVEVLRGPFSVLYGNAAGGVVQLWSAEGTAVPQTSIGLYGGSNDTLKYGATARGIVGPVDYNISASEFLTGGYRQHSRVRRESDNARFGIDLGDQRKLTLVLNRFNQPEAQDPLGLTRAQVDADPRQATPVASQFNTRKNTRQNQLGAIYEQALDNDDQLRLMAYYGYRSIVQYLSIPPATQKNPLQSGGVVAPATHYGGADARWTHAGSLAGRHFEFVLGASGDYQVQHRTGYENFIGSTLGVRGALRRDEDDNVNNVAAYAQWYWRLADRWSLLLGLRHDEVRFSEHDFYITAQNPDDSGNVQYSATTPVAGVEFRPADNLRLYVSYGSGFETPSYNELSYRSDGRAGLAFNLLPARSRNLESGLKWRFDDALEFDTAVFRSDTRNELAVATNQNGRATYRNVGDTRRRGVELSLTGELRHGWRLSAGFTHLQARFRTGFLACAGTPCSVPTTPVKPGSRMPGVPENYGSLRLERGQTLGWRGGLTLSGVGSVTVNDIDSQRAPGYGLVGLDVSHGFALGGRAQLQLSARVDNLGDRRYIGSVIVNDGNGRYFEPAPGRSYMFGARVTF